MLTTTSNGEKSNKSKRTSPRPSPRRSRKEDYEVRMHDFFQKLTKAKNDL